MPQLSEMPIGRIGEYPHNQVRFLPAMGNRRRLRKGDQYGQFPRGYVTPRFCRVRGLLMAASMTGPPPKENRVRRNKDILGIEEWGTIDPSDNDWDPPEIPSWVESTERTEAVYQFLMTLPQSRRWKKGEWFVIWMSLPAIEAYFCKASAEKLGGLLKILNPSLNLTEADMSRARLKWGEADLDATEYDPTQADVVDMRARRDAIRRVAK